MSVEFVDTNVFIYAHDAHRGAKQERAAELLTRLFENGNGAISTQVLVEFYSAAIKKLRMRSEEAEDVLRDLSSWNIHRPGHSDLLKASQLHR
ncbi:MAG: PIN domain-containing protein, partial [Bryobacteraceae bacterium]